ncbi:hypothetical protein SPWS13_1422 [Shewanella putrefaciens]|nr:hypothetical protein SPWS13_1422 [Shewanella putrefaciens]
MDCIHCESVRRGSPKFGVVMDELTSEDYRKLNDRDARAPDKGFCIQS